tara:strand:+ start:515 stop:691 length:177 start_codon:yes stop_codon:yes gene_type:complete
MVRTPKERTYDEWRAMIRSRNEAIVDKNAQIRQLEKYIESLQILLDENGVHWTIMEEE